MNIQVTTEDRHLCSHLIAVQLAADDGAEQTLIANLEEITPSGALLNCEGPLEAGAVIRWKCSDCEQACEFSAQVEECHYLQGVGYEVRVQFGPNFTWSPALFRPDHHVPPDCLVRLAGLQPPPPLVPPKAESDAQCYSCNRGTCPKEVIARLLAPGPSLAARVRSVGRNVADLCGEMSATDLAGCFTSLFRAKADCLLFAKFSAAYQLRRRKGPASGHKDLRSRLEHVVRLVAAVPEAAWKSAGCPGGCYGTATCGTHRIIPR